MAPKRLRRAPASLLEDNDDEPAPGSPPQIDVNGLARAPAVERNTDQQQRTRPRTFASQTLVCNNLCDEAGVQKDSLYGNVLFTSTGMAWKGEYKRYSNLLKWGNDNGPPEEGTPKGLLETAGLLLEGRPFGEFGFTKDKKYLCGMTLDGAVGGFNALSISPEHSAMIADIGTKTLRRAGECSPHAQMNPRI